MERDKAARITARITGLEAEAQTLRAVVADEHLQDLVRHVAALAPGGGDAATGVAREVAEAIPPRLVRDMLASAVRQLAMREQGKVEPAVGGGGGATPQHALHTTGAVAHGADLRP